MEMRQRQPVLYNAEQALDILLQSDDEDIDEVLDSEPESSSEESDFDDNVQVNAEIDLPPALDMEEEMAILPEERTKRRRVKGPTVSLDTAIDESNYKEFDPPIPRPILQSEVDKVPYKWEESSVRTGRANAANTQKLKAQPQKGCRGKTSAVLIWKQFITSQIIALIL